MPPYRRRGSENEDNYTREQDRLIVTIGNIPAGICRRYRSGYISFEYLDGYDGPDLSVCMPKSPGPAAPEYGNAAGRYGDNHIRPWLEGVLPNNKRVMSRMLQHAETQSQAVSGTFTDLRNKPKQLNSKELFALLRYYGSDCPGAVRFADEERAADLTADPGYHRTRETFPGENRIASEKETGSGYEPCTDTEIAERLRKAADTETPEWHGPGERWSLGGAQGKIALALIGNRWYKCKGSAASTHILKPGVANMSDQAMVEYLSMQLAAEVGLDVSETGYMTFDGVGAIVVKRYDRYVTTATDPDDIEVGERGRKAKTGDIDPGKMKVIRFHQEDLCQALRYMPDRKYDVTPGEICDLLSLDTEFGSKERFADAVFLNYLIGGTDAHAKNFSILHIDGRFELAPLYDVASILPYAKQREAPRRVAMPIGGEKVIGQLHGSQIERFAANNGIDPAYAKDRMRELAERVKHGFTGLRLKCPDIDRFGPVIDVMETTIGANCDAMLNNIDARGTSRVQPDMRLLEAGTLKRGR